MCHDQTNNSRINRLHERCLRLTYNDKKSSFEDFLEKDGSVSIHHSNLRALAVELFKVFKDLSPVIFAEAMPRAKTVKHGLESLSYMGSKL